jgi:hypothetical protein
VRTTVVRAARVATEEGQRECRANVVDNSGAAAIIGPVSGLCLGSEGAPTASDSGRYVHQASGAPPFMRPIVGRST